MHSTSFFTNRARLALVREKVPASVAKQSRSHYQKGILVVEDDPDIRVLLRTVLLSGGYQVFEADGEAEALRIWQQNFYRINLLLTDICIPYQTTGVDLAKRLRAEKSWLKVIYTSGFSREIVADEGLSLIENVNFFAKPFPTNKLLDAVQRCFQGYGGPALN